MLDHLKPGMRIKAYGPAGASFLRHPAKKYLFISAGSGITPMMSMTTWAWDSGEMPDIVFVHAARKSVRHHLSRSGWSSSPARVPGLQLRFTVEEVDPFRVWPGYRGRLNQIMLGLMAPGLSGARGVLLRTRTLHAGRARHAGSLGFDMARYHEESFAAPAFDEVPIEIVTPAAVSEITFAGSGKVIACDGTDTVLTVAKRAGRATMHGVI
jgi:ferredoxin-NADP reductase